MKIFLLFNKNNQTLVSATDNITNFPTNIFLIKEIDTETLESNMERFNLARYRWEGDFETGKLIDLFKERKTIVTEQEIDEKYYGLFFRKYNIEHALFHIINNTPFHTEDGKQMQTFLTKLLSRKVAEIEFYKGSENHIYESIKDQEERITKSFEV
jgi:hypothetical protein